MGEDPLEDEPEFELGEILAMPVDLFVQYLTTAYLWGEMAGEMVDSEYPPISCDDVIDEIFEEIYSDVEN